MGCFIQFFFSIAADSWKQKQVMFNTRLFQTVSQHCCRGNTPPDYNLLKALKLKARMLFPFVHVITNATCCQSYKDCLETRNLLEKITEQSMYKKRKIILMLLYWHSNSPSLGNLRELPITFMDNTYFRYLLFLVLIKVGTG